MAWANDWTYGVLPTGFLAQAPIAMTNLPAKPADEKEPRCISDVMQKSALTIKRKGLEKTGMIISDFSRTAILKAFSVIP